MNEHPKLRLELARVIRSIMELFQQTKDPRERQARRLLSHLAEDRFGTVVVSMRHCIEGAIALLIPEWVELCAGEAAARLDHEALSAWMREWDSRMHEVEMECFRAVEALQVRVRTELPLRFEPAIAGHCNDVRDALAAQIDRFMAGGGKKSITAQGMRELADRAGGVADGRRGQWLSDHQAEFVEALRGLASETVDRLERLYDEALEFAAGLSGTHPPAAKWNIGKDEAHFSWRSATPFEWRPRFAWSLTCFLPDGCAEEYSEIMEGRWKQQSKCIAAG